MKIKYIVCALSLIPISILIDNEASYAYFKLDKFNIESKTVNTIVDIKDKNLLKAINKQLGRGEVLDDVTIEDMESLRILDVQRKNISSLSGLEYATNIYNLHVGHNKELTDLTPIKNLTNLMSLHIHDTSVSDISILENLTKLSTLTMHWNPNITDISVLDNFKNLKILELGGYANLDLSMVYKIKG